MSKHFILILAGLLVTGFIFAQEEGTYYTDDNSQVPTTKMRKNDDDDIFISSPLENETVSGSFEIKVEQPFGNPKSITAMITMDIPNARDKMVWKGTLIEKNNYTVTIDASKFQSGEYELKVQYVHQGKKYDESIEFYVN
ncbi:MAG: hypothetical protein ACRC5H_08180 [Treponemataceae bacterium]